MDRGVTASDKPPDTEVDYKMQLDQYINLFLINDIEISTIKYVK